MQEYINKKIFCSEEAPKAIGPYSQAIKVNNTIYTSGVLGINPYTEVLENGVENQTRQALKNLEAILKEAGISLNNVIKTTVFVTDLNNFKLINEIYKEFFFSDYPCRSCVEVSKLPGNGLIEIEAIAVC